MLKETRLQFPLFTTETEWTAPFELKDLTDAKEIAIDVAWSPFAPDVIAHIPGIAKQAADVLSREQEPYSTNWLRATWREFSVRP